MKLAPSEATGYIQVPLLLLASLLLTAGAIFFVSDRAMDTAPQWIRYEEAKPGTIVNYSPVTPAAVPRYAPLREEAIQLRGKRTEEKPTPRP